MAEYYIETGKPSSGPLGAMGDKLCKGLEAANKSTRGPALDILDRISDTPDAFAKSTCVHPIRARARVAEALLIEEAEKAQRMSSDPSGLKGYRRIAPSLALLL